MTDTTVPTLTYAMIKPDAYSKQDEIFEIIKENGFKIVQMRKMTCSPEKLSLFYREHEGKPFFPSLIEFMASGPIVAMVLQKENAVAEWRKLIGVLCVVSLINHYILLLSYLQGQQTR